MSQKVFFPYGISNFAQIATQNYVYVDKTHFIQILEQKQERYVCFLRPRRFGKSLFVSLLEHYYDINRKSDFQKLFSQYYIGKNPTPLANSYRILFFNFSGINTETTESSRKGFTSSVKGSLEEFFNKNPIVSLQKQSQILSYDSAEEIIKHFFHNYPSNAEPIYILIDEYDHFTNEILSRSLDEFKKTVSLNGYVRKFYETIKNAT
ncbi:MAG: AAA family ATPase, partial [Raineya sp.]|nr:AAA family ATPase [Raineya sp.]